MILRHSGPHAASGKNPLLGRFPPWHVVSSRGIGNVHIYLYTHTQCIPRGQQQQHRLSLEQPSPTPRRVDPEWRERGSAERSHAINSQGLRILLNGGRGERERASAGALSRVLITTGEGFAERERGVGGGGHPRAPSTRPSCSRPLSLANARAPPAFIHKSLPFHSHGSLSLSLARSLVYCTTTLFLSFVRALSLSLSLFLYSSIPFPFFHRARDGVMFSYGRAFSNARGCGGGGVLGIVRAAAEREPRAGHNGPRPRGERRVPFIQQWERGREVATRIAGDGARDVHGQDSNLVLFSFTLLPWAFQNC